MAGGGAWSKISSIFFQDEEEDSLNQEEMDELAKGAKKDVWQEPDVQKVRRPQVMAIPTASEAKKSYEMVLVKAKAYDDCKALPATLRNKKWLSSTLRIWTRKPPSEWWIFFPAQCLHWMASLKRLAAPPFCLAPARLIWLARLWTLRFRRLVGLMVARAAVFRRGGVKRGCKVL